LQLGLGVLFALMLAMSAWLGRTLLVWGHHVRGIESALRRPGAEAMPVVTRTGEPQLCGSPYSDDLNRRICRSRRRAGR
jgi:hypothetical protein